tara:strand:- start:50 stop:571 length:522 start_codon:yes stop_codon:yes gene_type:complete
VFSVLWIPNVQQRVLSFAARVAPIFGMERRFDYLASPSMDKSGSISIPGPVGPAVSNKVIQRVWHLHIQSIVKIPSLSMFSLYALSDNDSGFSFLRHFPHVGHSSIRKEIPPGVYLYFFLFVPIFLYPSPFCRLAYTPKRAVKICRLSEITATVAEFYIKIPDGVNVSPVRSL